MWCQHDSDGVKRTQHSTVRVLSNEDFLSPLPPPPCFLTLGIPHSHVSFLYLLVTLGPLGFVSSGSILVHYLSYTSSSSSLLRTPPTGIMPWLAAAHCAFGLWMHTYFRVALPSDSSARGGIEEVSQLSAAVTSSRLSTSAVNLSVLQHSSVWRRITQPNGLPLLLLLCGLVLWLLLGRCGGGGVCGVRGQEGLPRLRKKSYLARYSLVAFCMVYSCVLSSSSSSSLFLSLHGRSEARRYIYLCKVSM